MARFLFHMFLLMILLFPVFLLLDLLTGDSKKQNNDPKKDRKGRQ